MFTNAGSRHLLVGTNECRRDGAIPAASGTETIAFSRNLAIERAERNRCLLAAWVKQDVTRAMVVRSNTRRAGNSAERRRARHKGIEGCQHLAAEVILLHQELVAGSRHDEVRACPQADREFIDRRGGDDLILPGRNDEHRLPDLARITQYRELAHRLEG